MVPADNNTADARVGLLQHLLNNWAVIVLNRVVGLNIFVYDVTSWPSATSGSNSFWFDLVDITSSALPEM